MYMLKKNYKTNVGRCTKKEHFPPLLHNIPTWVLIQPSLYKAVIKGVATSNENTKKQVCRNETFNKVCAEMQIIIAMVTVRL